MHRRAAITGSSFLGIVKISVAAAALGAIGLLGTMQWTALAVRHHVHLASRFIFPATLNSQEAKTSFLRMNREYSEAVILQDKSSLENAVRDSAAVDASLSRAGQSMSFSRTRQQEILALQGRFKILQARSEAFYAAIENNPTLPLKGELADLSRGNDEIHKSLEALQHDLVGDFNVELSLIGDLLTIQATVAAAVIVGMILSIFFGMRSLVKGSVRRREEALLHEANIAHENERNMLRSLIDNIPDFIYVKDAEGRFLIANVFLADAIGLENPEELLGKTDFEFFPPALAESFAEAERKVIQSGIALRGREESFVDHCGNEISYLTTKVPLRNAAGQVIGIAGIGHDITEHNKMVKALKEAELKYRGIFDKAIVGMFQSAPEGRFLNVNAAMAFTLGYASPDEMLASDVQFGHKFFVNPKRGIEFMMIMDKIGGVKNFEAQVIQKDGNKIWLAMNIRAIRENGRVVRYEGMCEDITERQQLRAQLLQSQKLESVGQLAAGIAHEINTPAQYIGGNVRFLKDSFQDLHVLFNEYEQLLRFTEQSHPSSDVVRQVQDTIERTDASFLLAEIPRAIEQTMEGIERVASLVAAMKEFSHPGTKEKVPLDLNHAIGSTITVTRNEWKYVAELETDFDDSLPPVPCYPGEFNQVILNLIVNAAHAIADANRVRGVEKGKITVCTKLKSEHVEIRVQDTGTGIPEHVRNRIFDPFFTTKEIGKGTGQGLAIARSVVVDKHGGALNFETHEGQGTVFVVELPFNCKTSTSQGMSK